MKVIERLCPVCAADQAIEKNYSPKEWPLVRCQECYMVYLKKAPDVSELFENLSWDKTTKIEDKRREKEHGPVRRLSKITRKRLHIFPRKKIPDLLEKYIESGKVLDVGCGPGDHILSIADKYQPFGIEISSMLAAQRRNDFEARQGKIVNADALNGLKSFEDNMFQAIIMRSFLEHDINPLPTLKEVHRTLDIGGVTIIKVPNYGSLNRRISGKRWYGFRFPDHVNYFTPKTLKDIVNTAGLSIMRFGFMDQLPTSDNMWIFAKKI